MLDSNEKLHIIDQYLLGILEETKVKEVEKMINNDDAFADLVRERKNLKDGIEFSGRQILKDKIKSIHQKSTSSQINENTLPAKSKSNRKYYLIIGLIIGSLLAYLLIQGFNDGKSSQVKLSSENIYAQYFEPIDISEIKRSGTSNADDIDLNIKIESLYNQKKYQEAIPLILDKLSNSPERSSTDLIALGISYMEVKDFQKSIDAFDEVLDSQDFNYENDATWYKALVQVRQEKIDLAKVTLQPLIEDINADYHREAVSLLKDLK